jgi:hypothetical protein
MSIEIGGSPPEAPLSVEVPAAATVELPGPTSSSADTPDVPPVPESALEVEQIAEAPNTLPEDPVPDSALDLEQPADPDQPAALPETPESALLIASETDPAAVDETPALLPEQIEHPDVAAPTEQLNADASENPVDDPEAPAAQVETDQSDIPPDFEIDEPPATTDADEPRNEPSGGETTQADPETPERRESPLGKASEHPDRTLSPAEHEARKQAGLARSRELIGKQNWANSKYAGEKFYDALPQELQEKFPDGVDFSYEGFPIFDPHATHTVEFPDGFGASRDDDFSKANKEAGFADTPADQTWHHKEDGTTLLLVDAQLHGAVRHWGGVKITKLLSQDNPEA